MRVTEADDLEGRIHELIAFSGEPPLLWHYTTIDTLINIVKYRSVWLSSFAFMNDPDEGRLSSKAVGKLWRTASNTVSLNRKFVDKPSLIDSLNGAEDLRPQDYTERTTFILSLSELGDSLSQWARYGADGNGVALGFRVQPTQLKASLDPSGWRAGPYLHRVIYDWQGESPPSEAPAAVVYETRKFKREAYRCFERLFEDASVSQMIGNGIYTAAQILRPVLKQISYHEEREWRITLDSGPSAVGLYEFRASRFGAIPYVPLGLDGLQLEEIKLGPKLSTDNDWSVAWLCKKYLLRASVTRSSFAYR